MSYARPSTPTFETHRWTRPERRRFVEQEITYTDASAGRRTAQYILQVLGASQV